MASMWCEKCQKITYGKKCDFCGHENKDNSKTYTLPKIEKARISKYPIKRKEIKLIKCNVCENEISKKATKCPHCGDTKTKKLIWKIVKIIIIVGAILTIIKIIIAAIFFGTVATVYKDEIKETAKEIEKINQVQKNFTKQLKKSIKPIEFKYKKPINITKPTKREPVKENIFLDHSYWKINKENTKLKKILKKNNINYWTILKQKLYTENKKEMKNGVLYSKKRIIIENETLKELLKKNNIKIEKY